MSMKRKIQILVMVEAEEHELDSVCLDLESGIEDHVSVLNHEEVYVLEVEPSDV
jgi:hypothetical protein